MSLAIERDVDGLTIALIVPLGAEVIRCPQVSGTWDSANCASIASAQSFTDTRGVGTYYDASGDVAGYLVCSGTDANILKCPVGATTCEVISSSSSNCYTIGSVEGEGSSTEYFVYNQKTLDPSVVLVSADTYTEYQTWGGTNFSNAVGLGAYKVTTSTTTTTPTGAEMRILEASELSNIAFECSYSAATCDTFKTFTAVSHCLRVDQKEPGDTPRGVLFDVSSDARYCTMNGYCESVGSCVGTPSIRGLDIDKDANGDVYGFYLKCEDNTIQYCKDGSCTEMLSGVVTFGAGSLRVERAANGETTALLLGDSSTVKRCPVSHGTGSASDCEYIGGEFYYARSAAPYYDANKIVKGYLVANHLTYALVKCWRNVPTCEVIADGFGSEWPMFPVVVENVDGTPLWYMIGWWSRNPTHLAVAASDYTNQATFYSGTAGSRIHAYDAYLVTTSTTSTTASTVRVEFITALSTDLRTCVLESGECQSLNFPDGALHFAIDFDKESWHPPRGILLATTSEQINYCTMDGTCNEVGSCGYAINATGVALDKDAYNEVLGYYLRCSTNTIKYCTVAGTCTEILDGLLTYGDAHLTVERKASGETAALLLGDISEMHRCPVSGATADIADCERIGGYSVATVFYDVEAYYRVDGTVGGYIAVDYMNGRVLRCWLNIAACEELATGLSGELYDVGVVENTDGTPLWFTTNRFGVQPSVLFIDANNELVTEDFSNDDGNDVLGVLPYLGCPTCTTTTTTSSTASTTSTTTSQTTTSTTTTSVSSTTSSTSCTTSISSTTSTTSPATSTTSSTTTFSISTTSSTTLSTNTVSTSIVTTSSASTSSIASSTPSSRTSAMPLIMSTTGTPPTTSVNAIDLVIVGTTTANEVLSISSSAFAATTAGLTETTAINATASSESTSTKMTTTRASSTTAAPEGMTSATTTATTTTTTRTTTRTTTTTTTQNSTEVEDAVVAFLNTSIFAQAVAEAVAGNGSVIVIETDIGVVTVCGLTASNCGSSSSTTTTSGGTGDADDGTSTEAKSTMISIPTEVVYSLSAGSVLVVTIVSSAPAISVAAESLSYELSSSSSPSSSTSSSGTSASDSVAASIVAAASKSLAKQGISTSSINDDARTTVEVEVEQAAEAVSFQIVDADGQPVSIKNLTTPINITFPITLNKTIDELKQGDFVCLYWDTSFNEWSAEGLSADYNSDSPGEVTCWTSHLTVFTVLFVRAFASTILCMNLLIFSADGLEALGDISFWVFGAPSLLYIALLAFLMMILAIAAWLDSRRYGWWQDDYYFRCSVVQGVGDVQSKPDGLPVDVGENSVAIASSITLRSSETEGHQDAAAIAMGTLLSSFAVKRKATVKVVENRLVEKLQLHCAQASLVAETWLSANTMTESGLLVNNGTRSSAMSHTPSSIPSSSLSLSVRPSQKTKMLGGVSSIDTAIGVSSEGGRERSVTVSSSVNGWDAKAHEGAMSPEFLTLHCTVAEKLPIAMQTVLKDSQWRLMWRLFLFWHPIFDIFCIDVETSNLRKAFGLTNSLLGSMLVTVLFFQTTGSTMTVKSDPMCEDPGNLIWIVLASTLGTFIAVLPVLLSTALAKRRVFVAEEWTDAQRRYHIRKWNCLSKVIWLYDIALMSACIFFTSSFLANLNQVDYWKWTTSFVTIVFRWALLMPFIYAFAVVLLVDTVALGKKQTPDHTDHTIIPATTTLTPTDQSVGQCAEGVSWSDQVVQANEEQEKTKVQIAPMGICVDLDCPDIREDPEPCGHVLAHVYMAWL